MRTPSVRWGGTILVSLALTAALTTAGAGAAPIDDLRARAQELESQLEENGVKVAALGEQINAAQLALDQAQAEIEDAQARIAVAKAEMARLRDLIRGRAAVMYRKGGGSAPALDAASATDVNRRTQYGEAAARSDDKLIIDLAAARAGLSERRQAAERARADAEEQRAALSAARAEANAAANEQQRLLDQVQGELVELVREEQARREAAAAAASPRVGGSGWSGPAPNPSGGAGAAVAFAYAQLGKPYRFAATGPNAYDCSGLTMRAWQAGGLSLPHYSGAQAAMFPRVSLNQLQPGDLITTTSFSGHIGIWVGGGFIHAPRTGDVVRFIAGSGRVRGAVRPG